MSKIIIENTWTVDNKNFADPLIITKSYLVSDYDGKKIPNECDMHTVSLPTLAKVSTYLKARKATRNKRDKTWDRLVFEDFAVKGEWLEAAMKITGSSEIYVKDSIHALLMEGSGYTMVLMPIKNKETDKNTGEEKRMPITNFEEV